MAKGDALTKQTINEIISGQDVNLDITCYQEDGSTLRDMTTGAYKLTWYAQSLDATVTVTKTSTASQITLGSPDNNSVRVTLTDTDTTNMAGHVMRWRLTGTDTSDDNQFVGAFGEWTVSEWP